MVLTFIAPPLTMDMQTLVIMNFQFNWHSRNIPYWELYFKSYTGRPNLRFLEIGCFEGAATLWLMENVLTDKSSQMEVVDTFSGSMEHSELNLDNLEEIFKNNLNNFLDRITIHRGYSSDVLRRLNNEFDVIYIDGSHTAKDVLEDAVLAFPLLQTGGMMIFDDYTWAQYSDPKLLPQTGINAFLKAYRGYYNIIASNHQLVIKKQRDQL